MSNEVIIDEVSWQKYRIFVSLIIKPNPWTRETEFQVLSPVVESEKHKPIFVTPDKRESYEELIAFASEIFIVRIWPDGEVRAFKTVLADQKRAD